MTECDHVTNCSCYSAAHLLVRKERGPAMHHRCVDCDEWADHWSLSHNAQHVVTGINKHGRTRSRWSTSVDEYEPRCGPCHVVYDRGVMT